MRYLYLVIEPVNAYNKFVEYNWGSADFIDYEVELRSCIKYWRNGFNHLNDIEILVINPTKTDIKEETKLFLDGINNVTYIHQFFENITVEDNRWDIIPVIGKWLENEYLKQEDIIIHIDLDMYLIKKLQEDIINLKDDELAIVAGAKWDNSHVTEEEIKKMDNWELQNEDMAGITCFIVSQVKNGFYSKWLDYIIEEYKLNDNNRRDNVKIEELVIGKMIYKDNINIRLVKNIMTSSFLYTDPSTAYKYENMSFIHSHLHNFSNVLSKLLKSPLKEQLFK